MGLSSGAYLYTSNSYGELNLKGDKPVWQKAKPVESVYVKYEPKNNLPTY